MPKKIQLKYEWSAAYRIEHWVHVASIVVLIFTGFYIHWPFFGGGQESQIMAWMRFLHFVSMYTLIIGLAIRVYMSFFSRFDADWKDFSIIQNLKGAPEMIAYYTFLRDEHKEYRKYNPLQAFTYLSWAGIIVLQALTGFALYSGDVFGLFSAQSAFGWVNRLIGGESFTRILHFLIMWYFIITAVVHVYMSLLQTFVKRDRTFQSMFTGYKLSSATGKKR
jgi:Ni/Fe-hydrogenase 1 B-type cytochrome subunit